jgi:hypothetical protein
MATGYKMDKIFGKYLGEKNNYLVYKVYNTGF